MVRILHLDDEEIWRTEVQKALGHVYTVDSAETIVEAELRLQIQQYDLALVDQNLGEGRTGGDLLDVLIERYPATRRMVVTGNTLDGSTRSYVDRYQLDDVIFKGSHLPEDLMAAVRAALARPAGGLASDVVNHKADLSFRLRTEVRQIDTVLNNDILRHQEHVRRTATVHPELEAEAQQRVNVLQQRRVHLGAEKARLQELIEGIQTVAEAGPVIAEIERSLGEFDHQPRP